MGLGSRLLISVVVNLEPLLQSVHTAFAPTRPLGRPPDMALPPDSALPDSAFCVQMALECGGGGGSTFLSSFPSLRRKTRLEDVNRVQRKKARILLGPHQFSQLSSQYTLLFVPRHRILLCQLVSCSFTLGKQVI